MPYRETTKVFQRDVLLKNGYELPRYGADGFFGGETSAAAERYIANKGEPVGTVTPQPGDNIPNLSETAKRSMRFITLHWTAGSYTVRDGDDVDDSYHYALDDDGKLFVCEHSPADNIYIGDHRYAAHTKNANTRNIGVACAAMFGASANWGTSAVSPGYYPLTPKQVDAMCQFVARLAAQCSIPITRETVLSHAEWPVTHGVPQKGKWDFQWLPGTDKLKSAVETGDVLRNKIKEYMK